MSSPKNKPQKKVVKLRTPLKGWLVRDTKGKMCRVIFFYKPLAVEYATLNGEFNRKEIIPVEINVRALPSVNKTRK